MLSTILQYLKPVLLGEPADSRAGANTDESDDLEVPDRRDMLRKIEGRVHLRNIGAAKLEEPNSVQSWNNLSNKLNKTELDHNPSK